MGIGPFRYPLFRREKRANRARGCGSTRWLKLASLKPQPLAILLCASATLATATVTSANPDATAMPDVCSLFDTETDFVDFDLSLPRKAKTVHLRFPARYVENPRGYGGHASRTTSYILVDINSFEPISRAEEGRRFKAGNYDSMGVLLRDAVSLAEHAVIDANLATHLRWKLEDYTEEAGGHGLLRLDYESPRDETLLARNSDNEISDVFWCSREGSVPNPGCSHFFKFNDINVGASYRRAYLGDWRDIRARIERFLTCASSIKTGE